MLITSITHEGRTSLNVIEAEAQALGYPPEVIAAALHDAAKEVRRNEVRGLIAQNAGDMGSLLGTTSDAVQILLVHVAKLAASIATAKDLAAVKAAALPLAELTGPLLAQIDGGLVRMPYSVKSESEVIADIGERATAVTDALVAADLDSSGSSL